MDVGLHSFDPRAGRFDSRTHPQQIKLGPYDRIPLGTGINTVTLIQCSAVALQLVMDTHTTRLNEGATMPVNGVQRFIRNPFGFDVEALIYEDLPLQFVPSHDPTLPQYAKSHQSRLVIRKGGEDGLRIGFVFMPKKGDLFVRSYFNQDVFVSTIRAAKYEYADQIPNGAFDEDNHAFDCTGRPVENIAVRSGTFTNTDLTQWITDTGWGEDPVSVQSDNGPFQMLVPEGNAIIISGGLGMTTNLNIDLFDVGCWSPEWIA